MIQKIKVFLFGERTKGEKLPPLPPPEALPGITPEGYVNTPEGFFKWAQEHKVSSMLPKMVKESYL